MQWPQHLDLDNDHLNSNNTTEPPGIILSGYMTKVGSFLSGSLLRWITLKSNFTLWSALNRDTNPTKCYSLVGCEVEWGKLATKEYAIRITCRKKKMKTGSVHHKKKLLTLIVEDVGSMNMWVGGLRCLFAGTDRILCTENEVGGSTCSICLGDFEEDEELMILPCNHRFCANGCLDRWISISPKCPMCKRSCLVHGEPMIRRGTWKVVGGGSGSGGSGQDATLREECSDGSQASEP